MSWRGWSMDLLPSRHEPFDTQNSLDGSTTPPICHQSCNESAANATVSNKIIIPPLIQPTWHHEHLTMCRFSYLLLSPSARFCYHHMASIPIAMHVYLANHDIPWMKLVWQDYSGLVPCCPSNGLCLVARCSQTLQPVWTFCSYVQCRKDRALFFGRTSIMLPPPPTQPRRLFSFAFNDHASIGQILPSHNIFNLFRVWSQFFPIKLTEVFPATQRTYGAKLPSVDFLFDYAQASWSIVSGAHAWKLDSSLGLIDLGPAGNTPECVNACRARVYYFWNCSKYRQVNRHLG